MSFLTIHFFTGTSKTILEKRYPGDFTQQSKVLFVKLIKAVVNNKFSPMSYLFRASSVALKGSTIADKNS